MFTPSTPVTESYCKFIVSDHTISSARAFLFISDFEERKVFAFRFFKTLVRLVLAKRPWDRKDFETDGSEIRNMSTKVAMRAQSQLLTALLRGRYAMEIYIHLFSLSFKGIILIAGCTCWPCRSVDFNYPDLQRHLTVTISRTDQKCYICIPGQIYLWEQTNITFLL